MKKNLFANHRCKLLAELVKYAEGRLILLDHTFNKVQLVVWHHDVVLVDCMHGRKSSTPTDMKILKSFAPYADCKFLLILSEQSSIVKIETKKHFVLHEMCVGYYNATKPHSVLKPTIQPMVSEHGSCHDSLSSSVATDMLTIDAMTTDATRLEFWQYEK